MRRALTLIEISVSLAIASVILACLVGFMRSVSLGYVNIRNQVAVHASLQMARDQLIERVGTLDGEFWRFFPRHSLALCEPLSSPHPGVDISEHCAIDRARGVCLTLWDLELTGRSKATYKITDGALPQWLALEALDPGPSPSLGESLTEMSVLLVSDGLRHVPLLVDHVAESQVFLREGEDQPWSWEMDLDWGQAHVVHLGTLQVTHFSVVSDAERGGQLLERPLRFENGEWSAGRSRSSLMQIGQMSSIELANRPTLVLSEQQGGSRVFLQW